MCPMSGRQVPGGEAGRGAQGEESAGEPIRTCQNTYQNLPEPARTYPNLSEPIRTRQRRSGAYQTAGKPPLTLQVSCPHVMWRASMAFFSVPIGRVPSHAHMATFGRPPGDLGRLKAHTAGGTLPL